MPSVIAHRRALAGCTLAIAVVLAVSACGKSSQPQAPAPSSSAPSVPTPVTRSPMEPALPSSAQPPVSAFSAPSAASTTAAAAAAEPLKFAALNLGTQVDKDFKVSHATTRFKADDHTLYAAVSTTGTAQDANLAALWTFEDGQKVNQITQSITANGPATTTFKVHNRNDWPQGKYKVVISLNGKTVGSQDFQIGQKR